MKKRLLFTLFLSQVITPLWAMELSGNITTELRYFNNAPLDQQQHHNNASLSVELEFIQQWDNGRQQFAFVPFVRIDQGDSRRSHTDIRELMWLKAADNWEFSAGIRKVFWGVSESQHLVDIINQTDLVEGLDGENKLGQPMLNLTLIRDWGTVDFFLLPYFRERNYPGETGRLRPSIVIDHNRALYESDDEQQHLDLALRWSHYVGDWDFAVSYFDGTSRDPEFIFSNQQLQPYYRQIQQLAFELQATKESWLWKLETIQRRNHDDFYHAATAGFEYSFYGVFETPSDIGVVVEYLYDERDDEASTPFQNDMMLGLRLALNNEQSSSALIGGIFDLEGNANAYSIEASHRLNDNWSTTIEGRIFSDTQTDAMLHQYRRDDFIQLELAYYF